jgi:hypothetical protein
MSDSPTTYEEVREIMYDILALLHHHGISQVSVGGIMRLLGVPADVAASHDDEYLHVVQADLEIAEESQVAPPGTTLH